MSDAAMRNAIAFAPRADSYTAGRPRGRDCGEETGRDAARGQNDVRKRNLNAVFAAVNERGRWTRGSIAQATGLHRSTVASLVAELTELGMLRAGDPEPDGSSGRPAATIAVASDTAAGVGLEIRADSLIAHVSDSAGRPRFRAAVSGTNPERGTVLILDELVRMTRDALAEIRRQQLTPIGVALAVPGVVDAQQGVVLAAPQLDWSSVPLREAFRERLDRPDVAVVLESACTLAALAEIYDGCGTRLADYLYVRGDGEVTARVIVDGQVFRSRRNPCADAFGHLAVEADGPHCRCGRRGCLEARTSRGCVLADAGLSDGSLTDLMQHARSGDTRTIAALANCARWLGIGLSTVANLLAPPVIVLGGDLAALAPWLVPTIEDELRTRVLGRGLTWPSVIVSQVGIDAAARGAGAIAASRVDWFLGAG